MATTQDQRDVIEVLVDGSDDWRKTERIIHEARSGHGPICHEGCPEKVRDRLVRLRACLGSTSYTRRDVCRPVLIDIVRDIKSNHQGIIFASTCQYCARTFSTRLFLGVKSFGDVLCDECTAFHCAAQRRSPPWSNLCGGEVRTWQLSPLYMTSGDYDYTGDDTCENPPRGEPREGQDLGDADEQSEGDEELEESDMGEAVRAFVSDFGDSTDEEL